MTTDCRPAACAIATQAAATAVLPEPTSPFKRRFIGAVFSMSWKASQVERRCARVSSKPEPPLKVSVTSCLYRMGVSGSAALLARTRPADTRGVDLQGAAPRATSRNSLALDGCANDATRIRATVSSRIVASVSLILLKFVTVGAIDVIGPTTVAWLPPESDGTAMGPPYGSQSK